MVVIASSAAQMVEQWGYFIVFIIVLAQCAGVPLPAVAVLLAAEAAARRGSLNLATVIALGSAAAILGSAIGYIAGRIGGRPLMVRIFGVFHAKEGRILALERFFERHGSKTIFLGRWVIFVRLWGSIAAGAARMPWPSFAFWTVLGSILWVTSLGIIAFAAAGIARALGEALDIGGWILLPVIIAGFVLARRRRARQTSPELPASGETTQRGGVEQRAGGTGTQV